MASIDDKIAALHVSMVRAEDAGHSGEAQWYAFEIRRLEDADGAAETRRAHRRQLSRDYAAAMWSGNVDGAALIQAEIDRAERGQP